MSKTVKKSPTKDQLITDQIKDQLEEKMRGSAMDINVTSRDGVVHLSGIVDVLSERKYAESVARSINGVLKVENNITISTDGTITNKHIETEVINKLRDSRGSEDTLGVGVKVQDGVVNLIGEVNTLNDAHQAMHLASQIRGVKDVVNNTQIRNTGFFDDVTINNTIHDRIRNSTLENSDIVCDVIGGNVTLSGFANNKNDVELAKEIATKVEGVTKVHNRIKLRE